ncbi:DEAD/DEAH box helicase family protein [Clostridium tyrobutyricum]|uniref:DEAD/DEAH box helicase family protein n=1 Tax=Clostridium tyrobutyricum TaxID=1519 RepID=UPI001C3869A4|nr:DEAD/DEAH box helicase family protein [Clostridium tyrobutyricum]MBV4421010.1 DEAD/DEAH box helicase family protein [Clostridium tyrobutyricum]
MAKTKGKIKELELPTLKLLIKQDDISWENVNGEIVKRHYVVPDYIIKNLKHLLRPYQEEAIRYFHYSQELNGADELYNHLLFNMATGSGKTDVMAALILYLYEEMGYTDFIFVVNTNGVLSKTRENLLDRTSSKYLFKDIIEIDGNRINIKEVTRFPITREKNTIYLKLSTIQSLSNEINETKEGGLTIEELSKQKLVILGDEAHHYSAYTKKTLTSAESKEKSWENTLDIIRQSNLQNRQLEFTATIDIEGDKFLYEKYKNKIIYRYGLDKFISEGYSKKVFRLEANSSDNDKMLNAVLLSQYRKIVAKKYGVVDFKPVLMFKSNSIKISTASYDTFNSLIDDLNVEDLKKFIDRNLNTTSSTMQRVYSYYKNENLAHIITTIKRDFSKEKVINVNDSTKGILEDKNFTHILNSLEDNENPFRVVFAVAKLSEGWDVLNLYDIVRISEQAKSTSAATMSEAQLIGRGARYNPFVFKNQISYKRRFDDLRYADNMEDLKLLESLHYHTINDKNYIINLIKALDKIKLTVEDDSDFVIFETDVKASFKKSPVYKTGKLYYNEVEDVPVEEYNSLSSFGINNLYEANMLNVMSEADYAEVADKGQDKKIPVLRNSDADKRILKKALARNSFFEFCNLKNFIPILNSKSEFINSNKWLGELKIDAIIPFGTESLSPLEKLIATEKCLRYIQSNIKRNFSKKRGTNKFISINIKDVVAPYSKKVSKSFSKKTVEEIIQKYPMSKQKWFVYEDAIVDGLEKDLIELIKRLVATLKEKYDEVYLIRNDERQTGFKLHQFRAKRLDCFNSNLDFSEELIAESQSTYLNSSDDIAIYDGFMPDFILYLKGEDFIYQVYIEPKGEQLVVGDSWKQDILKSINSDKFEILVEDNNVKLYGVKFYTGKNSKEFVSDLDNKIFDGVSLTKRY